MNQPVADFIKDLRNNFGHSHLFCAQPSSTIQLGSKRTVTTQLEFDRKTLLDEGTCWSAATRAFIDASEKLDVMAIVTSYFDLAERLFLSFQNLSVLRDASHVRDYRRIKEARSSISLQMNLGLIMQQVLDKGIDPYPYLPKYFSGDELDRINCFEDHSQAQIEYIINLPDPLGLCRDDTRRSLYKLFNVKTPERA